MNVLAASDGVLTAAEITRSEAPIRTRCQVCGRVDTLTCAPHHNATVAHQSRGWSVGNFGTASNLKAWFS
jgi:hypothetical protein